MWCTAHRYFISFFHKLSFALWFALGLLFFFILIFFCLLVRFFPNTRFSNRSDFILHIKLSLYPRVIWFFLVVRILLVAHGTLLFFYKLLFDKTLQCIKCYVCCLQWPGLTKEFRKINTESRDHGNCVKFCISKSVPHSTLARVPGTTFWLVDNWPLGLKGICVKSGYELWITGYELQVTLFSTRSRIFLPIATQSCVALFCCRLTSQSSQDAQMAHWQLVTLF